MTHQSIGVNIGGNKWVPHTLALHMHACKISVVKFMEDCLQWNQSGLADLKSNLSCVLQVSDDISFSKCGSRREHASAKGA